MIYNDKLTTEYGINTLSIGEAPVSYQVLPTSDDYKKGYITRWFAKRINDVKAVEINPETSSRIDTNLYQIVSLNWQISGPKNTKIVNGIIENFGVERRNQEEISRVKKETEVDLSKTLSNLLELWRGY